MSFAFGYTMTDAGIIASPNGTRCWSGGIKASIRKLVKEIKGNIRLSFHQRIKDSNSLLEALPLSEETTI